MFLDEANLRLPPPGLSWCRGNWVTQAVSTALALLRPLQGFLWSEGALGVALELDLQGAETGDSRFPPQVRSKLRRVRGRAALLVLWKLTGSLGGQTPRKW